MPVVDESQVIRLAGTQAAFDLREWGIPENLLDAYDITTQLSIAAGLEALRDAGIPLVRQYKVAANGKRIPQGWMLPASMRDGTAVVFGSAFPGYDRLVERRGSMNRICSPPPGAGGPGSLGSRASRGPSVASSYPEIRGSAGPCAHFSAPARALCAPVPVTPR